jgi:peptidoglycan/LPS O-acetylase OafA/YrhL
MGGAAGCGEDSDQVPIQLEPIHPNRVIELDALRGIGAMAVLGAHLWPLSFLRIGWTRVDLFFVISGYLITSIILKHGSGPRFLLNFWVRRFLRIWPSYYLLLAILCLALICEGRPPRLDALAYHLTFSQNSPYYWSGEVPTFARGAIQSWSLAVEEQFYLVWPLVVRLAGRQLLVPIAIWLIIDSVVARILGLYPFVALARCDGLALGSLLSILLGNNLRARQGFNRLTMTLIGLGMASLLFIAGPISKLEDPIPGSSGCGSLSILALNILYFSLVGLVISNSGHKFLGILRSRVLCYLGKISYGVFLYHLTVIEEVTKRLGPGSVKTDTAAIILSLLAGAMSRECVEKPMGQLKDRFRYRGACRRRSESSDDTLSQNRTDEPRVGTQVRSIDWSGTGA